jgi:predicted ATPase
MALQEDHVSQYTYLDLLERHQAHIYEHMACLEQVHALTQSTFLSLIDQDDTLEILTVR